MLHNAIVINWRNAYQMLDVNVAYFAVRDVRATIVEWRRCGRCQTSFDSRPAAFRYTFISILRDIAKL